MTSPRSDHGRDPVVGLVLSGGGARSSFQIGALRYLYDRLHIAPSVITGTSAGSILAAVLAQHADHGGQRRALGELERLWLGMERSSDMFTELPWSARLRELAPTWLEALSRRRQRQGALGRSFARVAARPGTRQARQERRTDDGAVPGNGHGGQPAWSPAAVVESLATARSLSRAPAELGQIMAGAETERSMYRPGPIVDQLLDPDVFHPDQVARSGVELRIALVGLESGELRYVTSTGALVDREDRPLPSVAPVPLTQALRASCAIPVIFPPVEVAGEHYVDGGVREALPAQVALDHLGVEECFAVVARPPGPAPEASYANTNLLSVLLRATSGIMAAEIERDEVRAARAAGATVIAPEIDVHDALTIDPGLTSIAMDYGYLRAAEVTDGATPAETQITREIIALRRELWALEDADHSPESGTVRSPSLTRIAAPGSQRSVPPPATEQGDDAAGPEHAALRQRVRELLAQVPSHRLPPGAHQWGHGWERHPWPTPEDPPADAPRNTPEDATVEASGGASEG